MTLQSFAVTTGDSSRTQIGPTCTPPVTNLVLNVGTARYDLEWRPVISTPTYNTIVPVVTIGTLHAAASGAVVGSGTFVGSDDCHFFRDGTLLVTLGA